MKILAHLTVLLLLVPGALVAQESVDTKDRLSVVVRESKLRGSPSHWAPVIATVKYGDLLNRVDERDEWTEVVSTTGTPTRGFIHSSAVTARRVILQAGTQVSSVEVDPANVVLAGKGFNADVEDQYKSGDKALDFQFVDSWEGQKPSEDQLRVFLVEGGLRQ